MHSFVRKSLPVPASRCRWCTWCGWLRLSCFIHSAVGGPRSSPRDAPGGCRICKNHLRWLSAEGLKHREDRGLEGPFHSHNTIEFHATPGRENGMDAFASAQAATRKGYVLGAAGGETLIHFRDQGLIIIKAGPATGSDQLALGTQQVMQGTGIPTHRHFHMDE